MSEDGNRWSSDGQYGKVAVTSDCFIAQSENSTLRLRHSNPEAELSTLDPCSARTAHAGERPHKEHLGRRGPRGFGCLLSSYGVRYVTHTYPTLQHSSMKHHVRLSEQLPWESPATRLSQYLDVRRAADCLAANGDVISTETLHLSPGRIGDQSDGEPAPFERRRMRLLLL